VKKFFRRGLDPRRKNIKTMTASFVKPFIRTFGLLLSLLFLPGTGARGATITGVLQDISLQALDTRLTFAPTTNVLLTAAGLNAGPPRTIATSNGLFSIVLEAGDYTVSLPLVPWRRPFVISVFETNGTINITNLLSPAHTYTYTNDRSYCVKAAEADPGPGVLDAKLAVAGTLTKMLQTNGGVVSLLLSNGPAGDSGRLHVNAARVVSWSTNGESSLLDGGVTIPGGSLAAGSLLRLDAFGSFADPSVGLPSVTFRVKLGATTCIGQTKSITSANWHLTALVTIRSAGNSGTTAGTLALLQDLAGAEPFPFDSQTATVDTTVNLSFDLRAAIDNITDAEKVVCDQAVVTRQ
jgi:hypothetical protein